MQRYTEMKKWFEQQNWRWLVLPVLIAVTVALLATWSYPSAGELVVPPPLPVPVKAPLSPVAEQKPPADDALMNKLDERVKELESAQKALYLSWLDGQRKTVDWWLTFLGVVAAALALGGALIPFLMGRKDRELLEADHKLVKLLLTDAHAAMDEIKAFRDGAEEMSITMKEATQVANNFIPSPQDAKDSTGSAPRPIDQESKQQLERANDELKGKAEKNFTANEHYVRGASLYASGNFQGAFASFESAIQAGGNAPAVEQINYLFAKAVAFGALGDLQNAIKVYDEVDRRFGNDASPGIREVVVKGLANKGVMLYQQGKFEETIKIYDEVDRRFGNDASPGIREQVLQGLVNKGAVLNQQEKFEEAIKIYDEVDGRFGSDVSPGVREQVVKGLFNKGVTLNQQGKYEEAIKVYDEVDGRFGSDASPEIREVLVKGLVNKGAALNQQEKYEEAIKVYDEVDGRFGSDASPGVREQVVKGLSNKGVTLNQQGKYEEAIKVYDEVDGRFGSDASPGIRRQVAKALNGLGFNQIMSAKENWSDETRRQSLLSSAMTVLERSVSMCHLDDRAMILGNFGYALFLTGQVLAARAPTLECLKLGGQKAMDLQRGDAKLHRVELEDRNYENLLDDLWSSLQPGAL